MLPAGQYYIGDLCYVMHKEWNEFCNITISGNNLLEGEFQLADGRRFAAYGTAFGDGVYGVSTGGTVGVDAGLIGCIRVEDISPEDVANIALGVVVEFDNAFRTSSDGETITFGHVNVFTGDYEGESGDDWDTAEEEWEF